MDTKMDRQAGVFAEIESFQLLSEADIDDVLVEIRSKAEGEVDRLLYRAALVALAPRYIETLSAALELYQAGMDRIGKQLQELHARYAEVDARRAEVKAALNHPKNFKNDFDEIKARSDGQKEMRRLNGEASAILSEESVLSIELGKYSEPARRLQAVLDELRAIKAPPVPGWLLDWLTIDAAENGK